MNPFKRLLVAIAILAIAVSLTFAQGPKKDAGAKVPLPDKPEPIDKNGPPQKGPQLPKANALSIDVTLTAAVLLAPPDAVGKVRCENGIRFTMLRTGSLAHGPPKENTFVPALCSNATYTSPLPTSTAG